MVEAFNVDLIIDTGDITDYGTPLETQLVEEIGQLQIPYIFVAGNHDSPVVIARMGMLENVIVLDGVIHLEELDLVVAGAHDPASQDTAMAVRPKSEYLEAAQNLREKIDQFGRKPDIIAFHHVFMAEVFIDLPTVLLHGHSHRVNVRRQGEAVVVDSGTTGGAGVRGLMTREELPYSMVLLHFSRTEEGIRLLAADIIKVYNINSGFILERRLFSDGGEITGPQDTLPGEDPQTGDDED
jgi:predicted phosphodiesterase